jgi:hypothetical protein
MGKMVCVYCLVFLFKSFSSIYILPKGETVKAGFLRRESASEGEKDKSQYINKLYIERKNLKQFQELIAQAPH